LAILASDFERRYRVAIAACLETRLSVAVCTVYNGVFRRPVLPANCVHDAYRV
jgi:hypothetical protein